MLPNADIFGSALRTATASAEERGVLDGLCRATSRARCAECGYGRPTVDPDAREPGRGYEGRAAIARWRRAHCVWPVGRHRLLDERQRALRITTWRRNFWLPE